ncbi:MAG: ABC transporter ATP-binding protein, partial [Spirochaetota bacterium]
LAVRPSLLLMDEPFGSLDAVTRRTLQQELLHIWQTTKTSVLFVTHDVEEAVFLADRIVLLAGSPARVVEEYRVDSERPRHVDDAGFQSTVRRLREDLHSYQNQPML